MKTEELAKLLLENIGHDVQFCLWNSDGKTVYQTYEIDGICFVAHHSGKYVILSSGDERNQRIHEDAQKDAHL